MEKSGRAKPKKHASDVQSIINTIENTFNPFDIDQSELVHLTSGVVAPEKVRPTERKRDWRKTRRCFC